MIVAMPVVWTPMRMAIYGGVGVVVVLASRTLFARFLLVPLPTGALLQG